MQHRTQDHPRVERMIDANVSEKTPNSSSYSLTLNNFLIYLTAFSSASTKKRLYALGHCKKFIQLPCVSL